MFLKHNREKFISPKVTDLWAFWAVLPWWSNITGKALEIKSIMSWPFIHICIRFSTFLHYTLVTSYTLKYATCLKVEHLLIQSSKTKNANFW